MKQSCPINPTDPKPRFYGCVICYTAAWTWYFSKKLRRLAYR